MNSLIASPLQAVQLIPIFSYLNSLSDFLFQEIYLTAANQTKRIPIVNALYEYLEDHRTNQFMKEELIRHLLKGSDLYGEHNNEDPGVIFVNVMFDYIISSLVFEKYGNIYGFLVDVFRTEKNFQICSMLSKIKETLKNAVFENEYGNSSFLSNLSVNRIYNDIIMPLFPQPNTCLSLLSLDYIYAQAGSAFLRSGRINTTYYTDNKSYNITELDEANLFDEYLMMGYVIDNLLFNNEINALSLKAFALPALAYYVSTKREELKNVSTTNIIFNPRHWEKAYQDLMANVSASVYKIRNQINMDYVYQMHVKLSNFFNRAAIANTILDVNCTFLIKEYGDIISTYTEKFECKQEHIQPFIDILFMVEITNIGDMFKNYALKVVQESLNSSFLRDLKFSNVSIILLSPYDAIEIGDFNDSKPLPYDLVKFIFNGKGREYYAFIWENYTVRFLKETDDPQLFQQTLGSPTAKLENDFVSTILKSNNDEVHIFWERLIEYKRERFMNYLKYYDDNLQVNETWRNVWWKEFGLSLVPFYPCLINSSEKNYGNRSTCAINNMQFLNTFQNDTSSQIINKNTKSLLFSLGTTIKSIFFEDLCDEIINQVVMLADNNSFALINETSFQNALKAFSLEIEQPVFEAKFLSRINIRLLQIIVDTLIPELDYELTSVKNMFKKMIMLKYNFIRSTRVIVYNNSRLMFINTNYRNDTGYGYKFVHLSANSTNIGHLRTIYDFEEETLILRKEDGNKFIVINNSTLLPEPNYFIYNINGQLRRSSTKYLFSGILIHHDDHDENCNNDTYFEEWKNFNGCARRRRLKEKLSYEDEAVKQIREKTNYSENSIRNTIRNYILSDDNTTLWSFIQHCIENKNLTEPNVEDKFIINNPDMLDKLRYNFCLENNISVSDGIMRINSMYTYRERYKIEEGTSLENIIKDFNDQKAGYAVTFEDYYAVRNFATMGYRRIAVNTNEAKRMKIVLYKLAIRQSDAPKSKFDLKLFRVEAQPIDTINKVLYHQKQITLERFTLASSSIVSAITDLTYPLPGYRYVLYEMIFSEPYVRGRIKQFYIYDEIKSILLPGSTFTVNSKNDQGSFSMTNITGLDMVLRVVLTFKQSGNTKFKWYKKIMNEISRIKL